MSYCVVDDLPLFLDIRRDRYFTLSPELGRHFLEVSWKADMPCDPAAAEPFVRRHILTMAPTGIPIRACEPPALRHAWPGESDRTTRLHARHAVLALWCIALALFHLRTRRFSGVVGNRRRTVAQQPSSTALPVSALEAFTTMVRLSPVRLECLPFAVALRTFLTTLGFAPTLVLGVKRQPFAAHCWIQLGDQLIGDSLDQVGAFTAIRVVP